MILLLSIGLCALGVALSALPPETLGVRNPQHWAWSLWSASLQAYVVPVCLALVARFFRPWGAVFSSAWFAWIFLTSVVVSLFSLEVAPEGGLTLWTVGSLTLALAGVVACVRALLPQSEQKRPDASPQ